MDRNLSVAPRSSSGPGPWIRAGLLAFAVTGLGLVLGTAAPGSAYAQATASGTSMSVSPRPSRSSPT